MKRCPECRRDYYDDTLLYCLDDGNALLERAVVKHDPLLRYIKTGYEYDGLRNDLCFVDLSRKVNL